VEAFAHVSASLSEARYFGVEAAQVVLDLEVSRSVSFCTILVYLWDAGRAPVPHHRARRPQLLRMPASIPSRLQSGFVLHVVPGSCGALLAESILVAVAGLFIILIVVSGAHAVRKVLHEGSQ